MLRTHRLTGFLILMMILSLSGNLHAQEQGEAEPEQDQEAKAVVYVKGNALFIPIGIINAGVEHRISRKMTVQGDVLISPWKSFAGHELQYYSVSLEGRYYFGQAFRHWYVGANVAASRFVVQKWNYWNDNMGTDEKTGLILINSNLYQRGYSMIFGITGGYQFHISDRWNIDIYAAIGSSQDFYKGYDRTTGNRYDSAGKYNKSGEIIPYRGGVMISYKLK